MLKIFLFVDFFFKNRFSNHPDICFPLGKFWHIHRINTVDCMEPNQCSSVDENIAGMTLFVGESEVAFGP